jgi:hypothetical protein
MKKEEVPQDITKLEKGDMNWVNYVTDENGNYTREISNGWEPENIALEQVWEEVNESVEKTRLKVMNGELSPIAYYLEKNLMDIPLLASYVDKWQWQVKRHLKPEVFNALSQELLEKYAFIFKISVDELKNNPIFKK